VNDFLRRVLMLPEQSSTMASEVDHLHYFIILVTMAGATAVAFATLYFLVRYRDGANRPAARPGAAARRTALSLELTAVAGLLALFVFWWVLGFRQYVRLEKAPEGSLTVYVTAKQWMWSFAYPRGGGSSGVLYVPVGRPVELVMTSRDVIHSFYVPDFRVKQDVVPGRSTSVWFEVDQPGRHRLMCAELCGVGHSTMRGEVIALAPADYERALDRLAPVRVAGPVYGAPAVVGEQDPPEGLSLAAMGQRVAAQSGCLRCHTVDGTPHIGPTFAGLYGAEIPLADGHQVVADEKYLTESMMDPAARVHLGFRPVMPGYQGLLGAVEIGAVVEYIRTLADAPRRSLAEPLPRAVPGQVPLVQPLPPPPRTPAPAAPASGSRGAP
jgi:cytochrome c oxidase subunit II